MRQITLYGKSNRRLAAKIIISLLLIILLIAAAFGGIIILVQAEKVDKVEDYAMINAAIYGVKDLATEIAVKVPNLIAKNDYKNRIQINQLRKSSGGVPLTIIMYHNIVADNERENDYEVRVSTLERDMQYLKSEGYTTLTTASLAKVISGEIYGGKYAMLTFDDGFYSYLKYLPSLLEKYEMNAVASIVGGFSSKEVVKTPRPRCSYMTYDEVAKLSKCSRIEIACHTENLHTMKGRRGVRIKEGENVENYKNMLKKDTAIAEQRLLDISIKPTCYTYPYGEYCSESEEIVRSAGYNMTLTCYEHVNYITRDPECMYLLGRFNRSGKMHALDSIFNIAKK